MKKKREDLWGLSFVCYSSLSIYVEKGDSMGWRRLDKLWGVKEVLKSHVMFPDKELEEALKSKRSS